MEILSKKNYVKANDGTVYEYNYKINDIYYCPNNIIIDKGEVITKYTDQSKYLLIDYFIIDLEKKKVSLYDSRIYDSFEGILSNFKDITIKNGMNDNYRYIKITKEDNNSSVIGIDGNGSIIEFYNDSLTKIGNRFLTYNNSMLCISIPNALEIGYGFMCENNSLKIAILDNVKFVDGKFLYKNTALIDLSMRKVEEIGNDFLSHNNSLRSIEMPELKIVGKNFLSMNNKISSLLLPKLEVAETGFFMNNTEIEPAILPRLTMLSDYFLFSDSKLKNLNAPNCKYVGEYVLKNNHNIRYIDTNRTLFKRKIKIR